MACKEFIFDEKIETLKMILDIREQNPNAVKFMIDAYTIKHVGQCMNCDKYDVILYCYGHSFLIGVMSYFVNLELFEECEKIKLAIEDHNKLTNDKLTIN